MTDLQADLEAIYADMYAVSGVITDKHKPAIEARVRDLMNGKGWPLLDVVEATLDDGDESITVTVQHGTAVASLYLKWEMADGSVSVLVDTDGDGE